MIIDSSVIVAILGEEKDAGAFADAIEEAIDCRLSVANYVEAAIVVDSRHSAELSRRFDSFIREAQVRLEPVTVEQAKIAREAYRDYGKSRHRAALNFGDCFAYALAKEKGEPLLFKGDDFRRTDVEVAEY